MLGAPQVCDSFAVTDDVSANWVVRKINEARAYSQRCSDWCANEQSKARRTEEFFLWRYGDQLLRWAQAKIVEQGGQRKSVNLPAGAVGFRRESAKVVVDDEQAVIRWAKTNCPALVTVMEKLSKSALNEHIEKTGELPTAGVHIEPERERFYVR